MNWNRGTLVGVFASVTLQLWWPLTGEILVGDGSPRQWSVVERLRWFS